MIVDLDISAARVNTMSNNLAIKQKVFAMVLVCLAWITAASGQTCNNQFGINFEDFDQHSCLHIDTVSNPSNSWQIGKPNYRSFASSNSQPYAIVTKLDTSYPPNDTSSFQIVLDQADGGFNTPYHVIISGKYFINTDTIFDFWTIHFSPDNSKSWYDLLDSVILDTMPFFWPWDENSYPQTSGNSGTWLDFNMDIAQIGHSLGVKFGDTVALKFTFYSDSIDSGNEGLMFDDFYILDYYEGIEDRNSATFLISPNPVSDEIEIRNSKKYPSEYRLKITDILGQTTIDQLHTQSTSHHINVAFLPPGIYLIEITDGLSGASYFTKFIKQ